MTSEEKQIAKLNFDRKQALAGWLRGNPTWRKTFKTKEELNRYYDEVFISITRPKDKGIDNCVIISPNEINEPVKQCGEVKEIADKPTEELSWAPEGKISRELKPFQVKACKQVWDILVTQNHPTCALLSATGTGKTEMLLRLLRKLKDTGKFEESIAPYPMVFITVPNCIEDVKRRAENFFGFDIKQGELLVTSYSQLISTFGKSFISRHYEVIDGVEEEVLDWNRGMCPNIIICDEGHRLKNQRSQAHKIIVAYAKQHPLRHKSIFTSATLLSRVADGRCFAINTRAPLMGGHPIKPSNWSAWAGSISVDGDPLAYHPASMDRFLDKFNPYIVKVPKPTGKFREYNGTLKVDFPDLDSQNKYHESYDKWADTMVNLKGVDPREYTWAKRVADNKFREAADYLKAPIYTDLGVKIVNNGKACIIAVPFKKTIARTVRLLNERGVPRSKISLIWGGNDAFEKSRRLSGEQLKDIIYKVSTGQHVKRKLLLQLERQMLEEDEERQAATKDYGEDLRLGTQTRDERQIEIDRFQNNETLFCIFTLASGGTGLSLHHTDKNNYGQDVILRPRESLITTSYDHIMLVQGLGRGHRSIFSLSDTYQHILGFRGTIEEHVLARVGLKLKCLGRTVISKESWMDALQVRSKIEMERQLESDRKLIGDKEEHVDAEDLQQSDEDEDEEE